MKILSEIPQVIPKTNLLEQCNSSFYAISKNLELHINKLTYNQSNVFLFSGGHRLNFDGVYIETKVFSEANVNWQANTKFIDPKDDKLLAYTIKKLNPDNLLILNSAIFIQYESNNLIQEKIKYFKTLTKKIIVSLPINRFDFNRLKYTHQDIAEKFNGIIIDDTILICQ